MEWSYVLPIHFMELKLMSSPSLSDLGRSDRLEERGAQQCRAGTNAIWNSIHNAVISMFQKKELGDNELFALNEGVSAVNLHPGPEGPPEALDVSAHLLELVNSLLGAEVGVAGRGNTSTCRTRTYRDQDVSRSRIEKHS